jgi:phage gpG-like protein
MTVVITKDELPRLLEAVKKLTTRRVLVGIPDTTATRKPDPNDPSNDVNNAELGYIHEFGAPEKNIPARPFLMPGIADARDKLVARLKKAGEGALSGSLPDIDKALTACGLVAVDAVQNKIETGPFVPLSPLTIRQRLTRTAAYKAAGPAKQAKMMKDFLATENKPLIDTGALKNSITFVLRDKK